MQPQTTTQAIDSTARKVKQQISIQLKKMQKTAADANKQTNAIIFDQNTKIQRLKGQISNMALLIQNIQKKTEQKFGLLSTNYMKQKQMYNQNIKKLDCIIKDLSEKISKKAQEQKILLQKHQKLLRDRNQLQAVLNKQIYKNKVLIRTNNQLIQCRDKYQKQKREMTSHQQKSKKQLKIYYEQKLQTFKSCLDSTSEELVKLKRQQFNIQQLMQNYFQTKSNNIQKKVVSPNNISKAFIRVATNSGTNTTLTKTLTQQTKKLTIKEYTIKLIQQSKEADNSKILLTELFGLMNQNSQDSWKKPFAQITYYKKFVAKVNELKTKQSIFQYAFKIIVKLVAQYDTLLQLCQKYQKYKEQLQAQLIKLNISIEQSFRDGSPCFIQKTVDQNKKQTITYKQFQNICKSVNTIVNNLNAFNKIKKSYQSFINNKNNQVLKQQKTIKQFQHQISQLSKNNAQLVKMKDQSNASVDSLSKQLEMLQNELSLLKKKYEANFVKNQEEISKLNNKIKQLQHKIKQLQSKISITEKSYADEKKTTKAAEQYLQSLKKALEVCQQQAKREKNNMLKENKLILKQKKINDDNVIKRAQQTKKWQQILAQQMDNQKKQKTIYQSNIKTFQQKVKYFIKNSFNVDLDLSMKNCGQKLKQLEKNSVEIFSRYVFLIQSYLYKNMSEPRKQYLYDSIKSILPKRIAYTKCLFQGLPDASWDGWLTKIANKPNILVLMRLKNGFQIAAFSENPFSKQTYYYGKGFLMSLTNMKIYSLRKGYEGKAAKYGINAFVLGNNEFLIKSNFKFGFTISNTQCHFETQGVKHQELVGQYENEGEYEVVQFHQCIVQ